MSTYDSIFSAASRLPVDERLRLIDELAATVPDDQPPALSQEWLSEIERRSAEIDNGMAPVEPWQKVREKLMQKAEGDRAD